MTHIGNYAFADASFATSVSIAGSVRSIGSSAFVGCAGLTELELPEQITLIGDCAFEGCTGLTGVEIPSGVSVISSWAFANCSSLINVTIPGSVTTIETGAFMSCGLSSVNIPAGIGARTHVFYYMDYGYTQDTLYTVALPATVTSVATDSFYDCNLAKVNPDFMTPAALTTIEEEAFSGVSASFVWLSDNVSSVGSGAFSDITGLTYVRIPTGCTEIAPDAFPTDTTLLVPDGYDTEILDDLGYTNVMTALFLGGNG